MLDEENFVNTWGQLQRELTTAIVNWQESRLLAVLTINHTCRVVWNKCNHFAFFQISTKIPKITTQFLQTSRSVYRPIEHVYNMWVYLLYCLKWHLVNWLCNILGVVWISIWGATDRVPNARKSRRLGGGVRWGGVQITDTSTMFVENIQL